MPEQRDIDLRAAINAISDVVQNRPRPLRIFDQIYMKAGDMVLQSELVARWADGKKLAFIGDGDAISVCVAYLHKREIFNYGPSEIVVFDFDERICGAVKRFADRERLTQLDAQLYNCLDPFPRTLNLGNQPFFSDLRQVGKTWVDNQHFGFLFNQLTNPATDPEILLFGAIIGRDGSVFYRGSALHKDLPLRAQETTQLHSRISRAMW
jgi:hypothetical protein